MKSCKMRWIMLSVIALAISYSEVGQVFAAEPNRVVIPNSLQDVEGGGGGDDIPDIPFRIQYLCPASQFMSLSNRPHLITHFAARPDASVTAPRTCSLDDVQFRMSTTNATAPLSLTFADNVGSDETIVYEGSLTTHTDNIGPVGGPKEFDYIVELHTPFLYDPNQGNLLIDIRSHSGWIDISPIHDWSRDIFNDHCVYIDDDDALVAAYYLNIPVIQLTLSKPCEYILAGDQNDDCKVDLLDFAIMAANWLIDCNVTPDNPACVQK